MRSIAKTDPALFLMMTNHIYAMDTHFMGANEGPTYEEQAKLVSAAGYDDYYLTFEGTDIAKLDEFLSATSHTELGVAAVFRKIDFTPDSVDSEMLMLESILKRLQKSTRMEITLQTGEFKENCGNRSLDPAALTCLESVVKLLEKYHIQGTLYPHFGFYLETLSDALRLSETLNSPRLGVSFCGYHWYNVSKEPNVEELLERAGSKLTTVNLCGSRYLPEGEQINGLNPTIEPLDTGTLDNRAIMRLLMKLGYKGPIGIQAFAIPVSATEALKRSHKALLEMMSNCRC